MDIEKLTEIYQSFLYKLYREATPRNDFLYGTNFFQDSDIDLSPLYHLDIIQEGWYVPFCWRWLNWPPKLSPQEINLRSIKIPENHTYSYNTRKMTATIYAWKEKTTYTNSFPSYSLFTLYFYDAWIATIYCSNFWSYYFIDRSDNHSWDETNEQSLEIICHYLRENFWYINIYNAYTGAQLQQHIPIYGAQFGTQLTINWRNHFFQRTHKTSLYPLPRAVSIEINLLTEYDWAWQRIEGGEQYERDYVRVLLSPETLREIDIFMEDRDSNKILGSKLLTNITGRATMSHFRLRDLLFGEFFTVSEYEKIHHDILERSQALPKDIIPVIDSWEIIVYHA